MPASDAPFPDNGAARDRGDHANDRHHHQRTRFASGQLTHGRADLAAEQGGSGHDHKTIPCDEDRSARELQSYAPQLDAYAEPLGQATKLSVARQAVHLAIAGVALLPERNIT